MIPKELGIVMIVLAIISFITLLICYIKGFLNDDSEYKSCEV